MLNGNWYILYTVHIYFEEKVAPLKSKSLKTTYKLIIHLPIISCDVSHQHLTIGVREVTIQQKPIFTKQVWQVQQGAFVILDNRLSSTSYVHNNT